MPWGYISVISILIGFVAYNLDLMMKLASDVKFIRMHITKKQENTK